MLAENAEKSWQFLKQNRKLRQPSGKGKAKDPFQSERKKAGKTIPGPLNPCEYQGAQGLPRGMKDFASRLPKNGINNLIVRTRAK